MTLIFTFIDVISILFAISLSVTAGERFGDELSPNILVLAVSYFLVRSLLYWILFKSVVKRDISWVRNIFQSIFLILGLSLASFLLTTLPLYLTTPESKVSKMLLFFSDVQGVTFYFIIVPTILLVLSFIIHKLYKLEPW